MFESFGSKVRLSDELQNVNKEKIDEMIDTALALGPVGTVVKIDKEKALEIFKDSLGW